MPGCQPDTCAPWLELSLLGDRIGSIFFWGIMTWERSPCSGRENRSKALRNFPVVFIISWMLVMLPGTIWACLHGTCGPCCSYFCSAQPRARGADCMQFINKYLLFWVMTEGEGISWLWMTGWKSWNPLALGCQAMPKPRSHYYFFFLLWPLPLSPVQTCASFPCQLDKNKHTVKIAPPTCHAIKWLVCTRIQVALLPCCR